MGVKEAAEDWLQTQGGYDTELEELDETDMMELFRALDAIDTWDDEEEEEEEEEEEGEFAYEFSCTQIDRERTYSNSSRHYNRPASFHDRYMDRNRQKKRHAIWRELFREIEEGVEEVEDEEDEEDEEDREDREEEEVDVEWEEEGVQEIMERRREKQVAEMNATRVRPLAKFVPRRVSETRGNNDLQVPSLVKQAVLRSRHSGSHEKESTSSVKNLIPIPTEEFVKNQFKRTSSGVSVTSVKSCVNPKLLQRFAQRAAHFRTQGFSAYPEVCFHGTHPKNMGGIVAKGLLMPGTNGIRHENDIGWYGRGIYLSPNGYTGVEYSRNKGGRIVLVCLVLRGRIFKCSIAQQLMGQSGVVAGYTSHESPTGNQWVVFNTTEVLPIYLIEFATVFLPPPTFFKAPPVHKIAIIKKSERTKKRHPVPIGSENAFFARVERLNQKFGH